MNNYGGSLVARTLKRFGIRHLFSLPGHQILSAFDACLDEDLDLISTRHEASAVFMAQALAFVDREPRVVLLAGGPELTNALTGIAQAFYANTPLVVIAGSNTHKKRDKGFPQDMDQLQVVRPFTKWARSCHDVRRIPEYITTAFRQATRGRPGPTYIEIPYAIPLVVVVHNDQGWGMTRDMQTEFFGKDREIGNHLGLVRYDRLVEGFGGYGEFVERPEELRPALVRALQSGQPACVNVMVDPLPQSPGLKTYMLMEVMLGKTTYYERIPLWMDKLHVMGLEGLAQEALLWNVDRMLHKKMIAKEETGQSISHNDTLN
jgi:thiamine pyrophosphate-dependent acetolactate synthase large subunit-like protein